MFWTFLSRSVKNCEQFCGSRSSLVTVQAEQKHSLQTLERLILLNAFHLVIFGPMKEHGSEIYFMVTFIENLYIRDSNLYTESFHWELTEVKILKSKQEIFTVKLKCRFRFFFCYAFILHRIIWCVCVCVSVYVCMCMCVVEHVWMCVLGIKIRSLGLASSTFTTWATSLVPQLIVNVQMCGSVLYSESISSMYWKGWIFLKNGCFGYL